eukprot:TRINITY_DN2145_c0_g2_i1.p1 TRINITY_DN2145_c0_g2~~TRINITY_DN2145_c0_g2_i1.p1  ORF type:complete len:323 (-),score=84.69 TRINITY_DN2145_c0_g2_i1:62-1030(-)
MEKAKKGKSCLTVVVRAEGDVLEQFGGQLEACPTLKDTLRSGSTAVLVGQETPGGKDVLFSFLGFERTLSLPETAGSIVEVEDEAKTFTATKKAQAGAGPADDEENVEIKYVKHPNSFEEVCSGVNALVLTNDVRAKARLNRFQVSFAVIQSTATAEDVKARIASGFDATALVVLDVHLTSENAAAALAIADAVVAANIERHVRLVVGPSFTSFARADVLNLPALALAKVPEKTRGLLAGVVPPQIHSFLQADSDTEFTPEKAFFALGVTFDRHGCRRDAVESFLQLSSPTSLHDVSGRAIRGEFFLREILFTLGKLPKFGA